MRLGMLLLVLVTGLPLQLFAEAAPPRIAVENADFSFGEVYQGDKVSHTFTFANQGGSVLKIDKVKSSCGCTAALVSAKELAPGASGEVRATFDSTRFRGGVVKTVYLYTNDPLNQVVQLHLRGKVMEEVQVSTTRVVIGPLEPGVVGTSIVTLTNRSEQTLKLSNLRLTAKQLSGELSGEVLEPGGQVTVQIRAELEPGSPDVNGYLLLSTSSERLSELRLPVQVRAER